MGIFSRSSSCSGCSSRDDCKSAKSETPRPPDPNPKDFAIEDVELFGDYILAKIRYPGCTNFEGIKILLYHGVAMDVLVAAKNLDPHFSEEGIAPIARFVPTDEGWLAGRLFAEERFQGSKEIANVPQDDVAAVKGKRMKIRVEMIIEAEVEEEMDVEIVSQTLASSGMDGLKPGRNPVLKRLVTEHIQRYVFRDES